MKKMTNLMLLPVSSGDRNISESIEFEVESSYEGEGGKVKASAPYFRR
jgi:hypothetical protein